MGRAVRAVDEPAEVAVAGEALDQQDEPLAVLEQKLGPEDRSGGGFAALGAQLRGGGEAHDPVKPVVVGQSERGKPQRCRSLDERRRIGGAVQEGEIAVAVQLDVNGGAG